MIAAILKGCQGNDALCHLSLKMLIIVGSDALVADLLMEFGAAEAINLDGGDSTSIVVGNKLVNRPSDQTGERPVSDAMLVFSQPN